MKKIPVKILILYSAALVCLIFASSCADGAEISKTDAENLGNTAEATEEYTDLYDPMLPEEDFGGYEFKILNVDSSAMSWAIVIVDAEEQSGDTVEDAIYLRNRNIEGKVN